jgi:small-conductance mechanosensitive channel
MAAAVPRRSTFKVAMLDTLLQYLRTPLIVLSGTQVSTLTLLAALCIVIVARILASLVARTVERVLEVRGLDKGLRHSVGKISKYVVITIGVFVALGTIGVDTSAIMAGGAVLLVGIGFGLQKLAENFISGLLLLIERPVRKGDFVDIGGVLGTVEDIGLRATHVLSRDGVTVIVPNSNLISGIVVNRTVPTTHCRVWIKVGVAYGTNLELACKVLVELALADDEVEKKPSPEVRLQNFGESAIELALVAWIPEAKDDLAITSRLRFAIDKAFREHAIEMPFPQRVVHTKAA